MGIATYPAAAGGGIKSVQRGSAGGAGNITIAAVDITKSFVNIYGTSSSGTVSASFGMNQGNGNIALIGAPVFVPNTRYIPSGANFIGGVGGNDSGWSATVASNNGAITVNAGSNNLVAAVVQGFLANSTTLTVSGACRYEVVEFN